MRYTYPQNDFDRPAKLLGLLGSLWSRTHPDGELETDRCRMRLEQARQHNATLQEAVDAISRHSIPLHQKYIWHGLSLLESEMDQAAAAWHFDDPALPDFDATPGFTFDLPTVSTAIAAEAPDNLSGVLLVTDRLTDATVVLNKDIDFLLDLSDGNIIFRSNPFENSALTSIPVFTDGVVTDRQLQLWLFQAEFDTNLITNHFGYVLGLELDTSQGYKDVVNAAMDAMVDASSKSSIERLLSAIYDVPLVISDGEVVEAVEVLGGSLVVVTDQNVYKYASGATAAVSADDMVDAGDVLIESFEIHDLRDGTLPSGIGGITLAADYLDPAVGGTISWEDTTVAVIVTGAAGSERVSWQLGGAASVVTTFWDIVHQRRLIYGDSLYDLLAAQPGGVPATINPLEFLVEQIFRNNAMIVIIHADGVGDNALTIDADKLFRRVMPPHSTLIVIVLLPTMEDVLSWEDGAGGLSFGMEPFTDTFGGMVNQISLWAT